MAHFILLERANFGLWGDITSAEDRVPPPVTYLMSYFRGTPYLSLWGDIIYGWTLNENLVKIWQHWYHLVFAIFSIIKAAAAPGHIQYAADLLYVIVLPIAHACKLGVQRMARH